MPGSNETYLLKKAQVVARRGGGGRGEGIGRGESRLERNGGKKEYSEIKSSKESEKLVF